MVHTSTQSIKKKQQIKMVDLENKKIDVLITESTGVRSEIMGIVKSNHNSLFAFITSLGLFVGVFFQLKNPTQSEIGILACVIGQIEAVILLYNIMLTADLSAKATYVAHIEMKINKLFNDQIVYWESVVSKRAWEKGTIFYSSASLSIIYGTAFIALSFYCDSKIEYPVCKFLLISFQVIEAIGICVLLYRLMGERKRVTKDINDFLVKHGRELI